MPEIPPFAPIHEAALIRHGSAALQARLATPRTAGELRAVPDDRYLSLLSLRTFRAGLKHSLVDAKWPAFEEAFAGFDPQLCGAMPDEGIEALLQDRRLIRHLPKLRAVRANARAVLALAAEHGGVGAWLADWPASDIVGLFDELGRRFQQLGGNSGPAFLRMAGKDTFLLTDSVLHGLDRWGAFPGPVRSKADRRAVQAVFNAWTEEAGLPLCQLSQILASSTD
jgi:3-methyladenine DNA glycosylase Tag